MMRIIRDVSLWFLIEDAKKKRIVLYTDKKYYAALCQVLQNIDVEIEYAVSDEGRDELRSVYDLMFENYDEIMVVVAKDDYDFPAARLKLEGMGFSLGVNFKNIRKYVPECLSMPYYYDPVCGFNLFTGNEKTNGFKIFGDMKDRNSIRILTMGGSTTDAFLYPFKSWSEILHERLEECGVPNIVYGGGLAAIPQPMNYTK
ncbi:MAG: hypothetical protein ACXAHE_03275 [Roseburia sp. 1XD42-69]